MERSRKARRSGIVERELIHVAQNGVHGQNATCSSVRAKSPESHAQKAKHRPDQHKMCDPCVNDPCAQCLNKFRAPKKITRKLAMPLSNIYIRPLMTRAGPYRRTYPIAHRLSPPLHSTNFQGQEAPVVIYSMATSSQIACRGRATHTNATS